MLDALRAAYGFAEIGVGERLTGGYANALFKVDADGRELVLRLKAPPIDVADIAWEHRLTCALTARLPSVPAPLVTCDGETWLQWGEGVAWLLPLIAAAPADPGREHDRLAAARALGRLHRVE